MDDMPDLAPLAPLATLFLVRIWAITKSRLSARPVLLLLSFAPQLLMADECPVAMLLGHIQALPSKLLL